MNGEDKYTTNGKQISQSAAFILIKHFFVLFRRPNVLDAVNAFNVKKSLFLIKEMNMFDITYDKWLSAGSHVAASEPKSTNINYRTSKETKNNDSPNIIKNHYCHLINCYKMNRYFSKSEMLK